MLLRVYVFEMNAYGVSNEITLILSFVIALIGTLITSSGYGIGMLVFKVPIRHLYSFIFGFVFAVISLGVVWTTKKIITPVISDDYIIVVFLFIGGFYSARIINWIITKRGNKTAVSANESLKRDAAKDDRAP